MSCETLVRDVMRRPVIAPAGTWLRELVRLTRDCETDCLAIADAEGRLVGVVTDEDLLMKLLRKWVESRSVEPESRARRVDRRKAVGLSAWELMSDPVVTADSGLEAAQAAGLMRSHDLRHLLVVDGEGRPTGVVHRADLLEVLGELAARGIAYNAVNIAVQGGVVTIGCNPVDEATAGQGQEVAGGVDGVVAVRTRLGRARCIEVIP